ncbi:MAG TPA: hypothetical protein PKN29_14550 [Candidatus Ozemobacteraceae bacterium]|nr:hypothetical protein [Candidatus Ozemobacteraceae bacterium]
MIDNRGDFAVKHREDVIDTLRLRAREKRVLYGLLIILLLTLVYENGGSIIDSLVNESFETAQLGDVKRLSVKPESLKKLVRSLKPVIKEYPQYAGRLNQDLSTAEAAIQMTARPEMSEQAVASTRELIARLFEFVSHPVINRNKSLDALEAELNGLAKFLQVKTGKSFIYTSLKFKKTIPAAEGQGSRNLFEFN